MQISRAPHTPDLQLLTDIQAKIDALFARCPMLCGFSIQDRAMLPIQLDDRVIPDADLFITEIGIYPKLGADLQSEIRSEEHTSELQSQSNLVCRLLLEKKKKKSKQNRMLNDTTSSV